MEIKNKVALITGAASGLGEQTARTLAEKGARLALLDLNKAATEKLAKTLGGVAIECNVSEAGSVEKAIEKTVAEWGEIHIAINCAGIAPAERVVGREGPHSLDLFNKVLSVNLIGTFNVMRLVAHQMSQQSPLNADGERGVVINTTSVAAFEGQIGQAAYSASKGGVAAMTLPVARELARFGIRVMTIAPGIMQTPMMSGMPEKVQTALAESVTFPQRLGHPKEYAALAVEIIENVYLNGTVIRLDGGIRLA